MATLLTMDISYAGGSHNMGPGFPSKEAFIEDVLPKLNLNFHNPELNGIVKQNGTPENTNGVSFRSSISVKTGHSDFYLKHFFITVAQSSFFISIHFKLLFGWITKNH